jgi:hypothetical protein
MPQFLIEVPHDSERLACIRAVQAFLSLGSNFATNADWGCRDGDHRAWIIVDVPTRDEARAVVPPIYRAQAKVIALNKFSMHELQELLREHPQ